MLERKHQTTVLLGTDSPQATMALAGALARVLIVGDVVVLGGELGAGKTVFAKGIGAGLGVSEPITSPTFTLANRYQGRVVFNHLDAYRLDGEAEAVDLAIDELIEDGVTVIEWGERIVDLLPTDRFTVTLEATDEQRRIVSITGPDRDLGGLLGSWAVN